MGFAENRLGFVTPMLLYDSDGGGGRATKRGNEELDKLEIWTRNSGQVGSEQDKTATKAAHKRLGTRTLSNTPPPPIIVYVNSEPPSDEGKS